jgi:DNA-binding HxlR family transcriptional regulator
MKVGTIKCNTNQKESVRNRKISQFTAEQIAMAKVYAAHTPLDDLDPRIEALVNDLIGRVADKWTMLILEVLAENGELRFTRLSELVEGISQKMLTQTLRQMERDGLLTRTVHPVVPPRVEYKLTQLGLSLGAAFCGVWVWAAENLKQVEKARRRFDEKAQPIEDHIGQRAKS